MIQKNKIGNIVKNNPSNRKIDLPLCSFEIRDGFKLMVVIGKNENGFTYLLPFSKR